jgi:N-acetylmuramoyl-L-alanine amidase
MKNRLLTANRIVVFMAALGAAIFVFSVRSRAAEGDFPIYIENSRLIVKSETINRVTYLPLEEIVRALTIPYTDATGLETFTIRPGRSRLVVTKNSALISINNQIVLLSSPILRENERWMAPIDFFAQGLSRVIDMEIRYRAGTQRIFIGVDAPQLAMTAQTLGPITRLTVRSPVPVALNLQREAGRATLTIDRSPVDPQREQVEHRDRLVRSIAFDDSDGTPRIVVGLSNEVANIRVTQADDNRVHFVDFAREGEITAIPAPTGAASPADRAGSRRSVRVIVIDPGHGGLDMGTRNVSVMEKELTLTLARKLRSSLQNRLGSTVLLTRDADIDLDNETRSAVANNNQADFFFSLHIGYSQNTAASEASIFVMNQDFGGDAGSAAARDQLFLPWYLGYRPSRPRSLRAARFFREELIKAVPEWTFPVRTAPLALLTSATMPSLMLEVGNLNNAANGELLNDTGFQDRLLQAIVKAIERFSESEADATN